MAQFRSNAFLAIYYKRLDVGIFITILMEQYFSKLVKTIIS